MYTAIEVEKDEPVSYGLDSLGLHALIRSILRSGGVENLQIYNENQEKLPIEVGDRLVLFGAVFQQVWVGSQQFFIHIEDIGSVDG